MRSMLLTALAGVVLVGLLGTPADAVRRSDAYQATVVAQALVGFILLARGASAPDGLHVAYGIAPLVVSLVSEGMRAGVAQRELEGVEDVDALDRREQMVLAKRVALGEMGVMTVGALLIVTLALRGYQTGG